MDYQDAMAELRARTPRGLSEDVARQFGAGTIVDARAAKPAPGEASVSLSISPESAICWLSPAALGERGGGKPIGGIQINEKQPEVGLTYIFFRTGQYSVPASLALYPGHKRTGPHGLHWWLHERGVHVIAAPASYMPVPEEDRFCRYCGTAAGKPHAPGCERNPEQLELAERAPGQAKASRGRSSTAV